VLVRGWGAHTLPRKFDAVQSTTTTRSRIIPNVRRGTPNTLGPGPSEVAGAILELLGVGEVSEDCVARPVKMYSVGRR
jgi:hypothetical protein